ncbi:MAG: hypothetical protein AAGA71_06595 [Pseudomonadota bacterium]
MHSQSDNQLASPAAPATGSGRTVACGPLSAVIDGGAIRCISYRGVEVVRGVDCPIRDANWGTAVQENVREHHEAHEGRFRYQRWFSVFGAALDAELDVRIQPDSLRLELILSANQTVETNRAGFTLLHPLDGVAGSPVKVVHSDGTEDASAFPKPIMASQPAYDIAALRYAVHGVSVEIAFSGEVFEMEDQRNWTDASFKTYCRPLALPFPYAIEAGDTVTQSIEINLSGAVARAKSPSDRSVSLPPLPEVAMVAIPAWLADPDDALLRCQPSATQLVRLDLGRDDLAAAVPGMAALSGPLELELIVDDEGDIEAPLAELVSLMQRSHIEATSVVAVPRAFLKSYQPSGPWPTGRSIAQALNSAAVHFPGARIGAGMLTNFTEFNRHAPPAGLGDFVTYSTTAIVHAADDRSVFETLEALPFVHESAREIAGGRPLRLGLSSIGMRSNPYGADVADNPGLDRLAMAMDDPRQRSAFGAAFAVGVYAVAADSAVARIALAGIGGPFATGAVEAGRFTAWPIHHVVQALASMASGRRLPTRPVPKSVYGIEVEGAGLHTGIFANCGLAQATLPLGGQSAITMAPGTDVSAPDWRAQAAPVTSAEISLPPAAVAFTIGEVA